MISIITLLDPCIYGFKYLLNVVVEQHGVEEMSSMKLLSFVHSFETVFKAILFFWTTNVLFVQLHKIQLNVEVFFLLYLLISILVFLIEIKNTLKIMNTQ